jgi:hypothetical protein
MEIKAGPGAVVIVPPSVRPSSGRPYAFLEGDWSLLDQLPVFQANPSRPAHEGRTGQAGTDEGKVPVGGRNDPPWCTDQRDGRTAPDPRPGSRDAGGLRAAPST